MRLINILLLFTLLTTSNLLAQEISIASGDFTSCSGFIVDSGLSASNYGANENYSMTVCPEASETVVNLDFFVFALGEGDFMTLYDGDSDSAPLIGTYGTNEIQGMDITSTNGCITILWQSDGNDNGNFTINVSCGVPCVAPVVVVEHEQGMPVLGCPGEEFVFDASASEFFNGASIDSFVWDMGDGDTDTDSWPTITHTYDEPGGYVIELYITDSEGCESTNFVSFVVLIATEPIIDILVESPVCVGSQSSYEVEANFEAVPWQQTYTGISGGAVFIPDDQADIFSSSIDITGFSPLEIIDEESDLESFFINFEHSFMGDLTIQFECPNGQIITVHQQGGGGTALGEPVDVDGDLTPGVGYDYWWSPTATNGTWADEATITLPSGTYSSVDSWENLYGCPVNGVWTIVIADSWASDNGYIFDWTVAFDPSLYPDLYNFEPVIGTGADSTFWNINPSVVDVSDDGNDITLSFLEPGTYEYTYTLVDNFGCSYDESYEVEAVQGPIAEAGPDITLCQEDGELAAEIIEGNEPFENGIWSWINTDSMTDSISLTPTISGLEFTTTYVLSIYPDNNPQCVSFDSVTVNIMNIPNPGEDSEVIFCPTDDPVELFTLVEGTPDEGGIWLDVNDDPISGVFNPSLEESQTLYYSFPDCEVFSEFVVNVDLLDFIVSNDTIICQNGMAVLDAEILGVVAEEVNYVWNNELGNTNQVEVSPEIATTYTVFLEYGDACNTTTQSIVVSYFDPLALEVTPEFLACYGEEIFLQEVSSSGGIAPYSYEWTQEGLVLSDESELTVETTAENSTYCLMIEDQCESDAITSCSNVEIEQLINAGFTATDTTGCYPIFPTFTALQQDYSDIQEETWNYGNGNTQTGNNIGEVSYAYETAGVYSITHTYLSNFGCTYEEVIPMLVHSYPYPEASFYVEDEIHVIPNATFPFHNISLGNETNSWIFYDQWENILGTSDQEEPIYTFPVELGNYSATLLVENEYGCTDFTSRNLSIENYSVYIPNAITPNNDGINEFFYVQGQNIDEDSYLLKIFNRWGDIVFESDDIHEKWNGYSTILGKRNSEGVAQQSAYFTSNDIYTYRLEIKSPASTDKEILKGIITVIR